MLADLKNWVQRIVQAVLTRFGFGLTSGGIMRIDPGEYGICFPYGALTYTPWNEGAFRDLYGQVWDRTLCTPDRCYVVRQFAAHAAHLQGELAECGVYKGATAFLIAGAVKEYIGNRRVHLFDSFKGMPTTKALDTFKEGDLGDVDLADVQRFLRPFPYVEFHPGFIPETFEAVREARFCFVHLDVDLYQSTLDCLTFFFERLVPGGIIICDDYGFLRFKNAARAAIDGFFRDKMEKPIVLRTSQCLVMKL